LDLVVDLNYFSFSRPNPYPTGLPKHKFPTPNDQFYRRILYVEYYSVHSYMVWSQKFRLTPDYMSARPRAKLWPRGPLNA